MKHRAMIALAACALLAVAPRVLSADTLVGMGETLSVGPLAYHDRVVVQQGGTLILEGGSIGTNETGVVEDVLVEPGGRFIMRSGSLRFFTNRGRTEVYGGTAGPTSSENRGSLVLAGGDIGFQLVHFDGELDLFRLPANRTSFEISSNTTAASPVIRIHALVSTVPWGSYNIKTLPSKTAYPGFYIHTSSNQFDLNGGIHSAQLGMELAISWTGRVEYIEYRRPVAAVGSISRALAVQWRSSAGRVYQVQKAVNLKGGLWEDLGTPQIGTGSTLRAYDTVENPDPDNYRVLTLY